MKNLLKTVRNSIAAAMTGQTIQQMEDEQRQQDVTNAVARFLESNPGWKPAVAVAPTAAPVAKSKRIMKMLGAGAGGFTPHLIDETELARARAKCREIVAADPAAYSYIIESAPIKGVND